MSIAMPSVAWIGPCTAFATHDLRLRLVAEQVHGVRGVMPQQMVGPRARLAERVHVRAPEKIGLHIHLLDRHLARHDAAMNPLVRGIEPARMADHADEAGPFRRVVNALGIRP